MNEKNYLQIFTDGGARGNPGAAAIGVYIVDEKGKEVCSFGEKIGDTTNNVAEYRAVIEALLCLSKNQQFLHKRSFVKFFLDSQLVVAQLQGIYKVRQNHLLKLFLKVKDLEEDLKLPIFYNHIPREKNKKADLLVNKALDNIL